ncbi:hypothetical protein R0J87_21420, partial [Halomonas sp. SIMBA_159]
TNLLINLNSRVEKFLMKWLVNPLHYPIAVLIGGLVLIVGVRLGGLPSYLIIPISSAIALGGAAVRQSQLPEPLMIENPALAKELESV